MFGGDTGRATIPPTTNGEKRMSTLKRASETLSQVKSRPDRGFRKSIDDAIAVVETEWRAQRERELAEQNRLERARQKAVMVRELMILPLLNDLVADFTTDERQVLPTWRIESDGDADSLHATAASPTMDDGGPSCFIIKAGVTVVDGGASLSFSVECTCIESQNLATGKTRQIIEKTKAAPMDKFEDLAVQMWFHDYLKDCVRMSVTTRMRHLPRADAAAPAEPAPSLAAALADVANAVATPAAATS
jgi:hypothetical protein